MIDDKRLALFGAKLVEQDWHSDPLYAVSPPASCEVIRAKGETAACLVVSVNEWEHVEWALFDWTSEDDKGRIDYSLVMHGSGFASSLREARHTYFENDGYAYYVNPSVIAWGFKQLERWFDFDGQTGGGGR
jgi:hypothetical protein